MTTKDANDTRCKNVIQDEGEQRELRQHIAKGITYTSIDKREYREMRCISP